MWRGGRAAGAAALGLLVVLPAAAACTVAARPTAPLTDSVLARWCPGGGAPAWSVKRECTSSSSTRIRTLLSICHKVHRRSSSCIRDTPCTGSCCERSLASVRAADDKGQTYLFGGPSLGNPSVPLSATCTSSPRRTAPSTHYCTGFQMSHGEPSFSLQAEQTLHLAMNADGVPQVVVRKNTAVS